MAPEATLRMSLRASQRLALLGRLRMAEWIEMPEREFARQVESIEKDPLFQKLFFGDGGSSGVIRRQRWPGGAASSRLYALDEALVGRGEPVRVEQILRGRGRLVAAIRRMGREAFERYFLYGDDSASLDEISLRTGLPASDVREIHAFILEFGAQAEFFLPGRDPAMAGAYYCLARIALDEDGRPVYEFTSPHWARGMYHVRHDRLESFKRERLSGAERRRLRRLLKRIEIVNLRQSTVFRILEALTTLHADYLRARRDDLLRPVSLRMLAQRLQLAPSTVSRALSGRSVRLPWDAEVPLIRLVPGRRAVLRSILSRWLEAGPREADARLMERLRGEYGIAVSRRTVNAVRNEVLAAAGRKGP